MNQDFYEILQVSPNADPEVIDGAYLRLSKKYHPDVNSSPDAKERMQRINEAYEILKDPSKRAKYDAFRTKDKKSESNYEPKPEPPPATPPRPAPAPTYTTPRPSTLKKKSVWGTIGTIIVVLLAISRFANVANRTASQQIASQGQNQFTSTPNFQRTIEAATLIARTNQLNTPSNQSSISSDPFPIGTPQSQRIQYACGTEQIEVLTFVNGNFARTEFVYKGGDEINVFGRVGDYYFVGANEQNIPYYVNWLYVCTQRAAVYFTPTPKLRPSSTPATSSQNLVWIAEFHTMQDRVLTICAKDAEVRGGPGNSYPILEHMNLADQATAFGWVRDWFYLGRDKSEQDYFIHNSFVCALDQTEPSQGHSPQPGSTSDPLTDYLRRQGYGTNNTPLPFPTFSQQDYLSSTPCDTYAYNQWAKGKSDRFVPECTPTPSAP